MRRPNSNPDHTSLSIAKSYIRRGSSDLNSTTQFSPIDKVGNKLNLDPKSNDDVYVDIGEVKYRNKPNSNCETSVHECTSATLPKSAPIQGRYQFVPHPVQISPRSIYDPLSSRKSVSESNDILGEISIQGEKVSDFSPTREYDFLPHPVPINSSNIYDTPSSVKLMSSDYEVGLEKNVIQNDVIYDYPPQHRNKENEDISTVNISSVDSNDGDELFKRNVYYGNPIYFEVEQSHHGVSYQRSSILCTDNPIYMESIKKNFGDHQEISRFQSLSSNEDGALIAVNFEYCDVPEVRIRILC